MNSCMGPDTNGYGRDVLINCRDILLPVKCNFVELLMDGRDWGGRRGEMLWGAVMVEEPYSAVLTLGDWSVLFVYYPRPSTRGKISVAPHHYCYCDFLVDLIHRYRNDTLYCLQYHHAFMPWCLHSTLCPNRGISDITW